MEKDIYRERERERERERKIERERERWDQFHGENNASTLVSWLSF